MTPGPLSHGLVRPTIAALYVQEDGCYAGLDGVDAWGVTRDARNYHGPHPVVAHPPCNVWCQLSRSIYETQRR